MTHTYLGLGTFTVTLVASDGQEQTGEQPKVARALDIETSESGKAVA